jgi:hypothetical protein
MLPHALALAICFAAPPLSWPATLGLLALAWELSGMVTSWARQSVSR